MSIQLKLDLTPRKGVREPDSAGGRECGKERQKQELKGDVNKRGAFIAVESEKMATAQQIKKGFNLDAGAPGSTRGQAIRDLALKDIEEDTMGWTQNRGKTKGDLNKRAKAIPEESKKSVIAQQMRKGLVSGVGTMNKES